jgi:prepilin-type processing-associated H-X9-DG protein
MHVPAKDYMLSGPAGTVMLTDAALLDCEGNLFEYSFCEGPYHERWGSLVESSTHFCYNGFTNVAFSDGHVRLMPMIATHASGWCPSPCYGGEGVVAHTAEDYEAARIVSLGEVKSVYDRC